jgi:hypothetical protein
MKYRLQIVNADYYSRHLLIKVIQKLVRFAIVGLNYIANCGSGRKH